MIGYDAIVDQLDRTQTLVIIERLRTCRTLLGGKAQAEFALCELRDPRSEQPLLELFMDRQFPEDHRRVTGGCWYDLADPDDATIREDWAKGEHDPVVLEVATRYLKQAQHDLIDPILSQPEHDLFPEAIAALMFGFS